MGGLPGEAVAPLSPSNPHPIIASRLFPEPKGATPGLAWLLGVDTCSLFSMAVPRFRSNSTAFHFEVRRQVNAYFAEPDRAKTGNHVLFAKALILWIGFISLYMYEVFFAAADWLSVLGCAALGVLTAAIGFNVMHDGAHYSFSDRRWLNELAGLSLNVLGANVFIWKTKHNSVHHTYTNIDGLDADLNAQPFLRLCATQVRLPVHRYQHLYFWAVYSLLYVYWVFVTDYVAYATKRLGAMPLKPMDALDHFVFWASKLTHAAFFVALPIWTLGFVPWLIGFMVYGMVTGVVLSLVFQLAHAVEGAHFPIPRQPGNEMEADWVMHQLGTTANFATHNKLISWLLGGLNFQIEHHLFPAISHVHYPEMSKIIKKLCHEHGIRYLEFPGLREALAAHVSHLYQLGRG